MGNNIRSVIDARKHSVQKVQMDARVEETIRMFSKTGCKAAVVVDSHGSLCGIVTEHDIVRYCGEKGRISALDKVEDIMSLDLIVVTETSEIKEAAMIMVDNNVHYLPVVNEPGHLMGFVSLMDIMMSFLEDK